MSRFSMVPMMFQDPWSRSRWFDTDRPQRLFDQHFGMGLTEEDFFHSPRYHDYYMPSGRQLSRQKSGVSQLKCDPELFEVALDVQQFSPNELSIKTVDRCVVIEGKHEEKQDEHGYISRQFTRKYLLPEGIEEEKVTSSLSSDGVLTITAPRKIFLPDKPNERTVPIMQTGHVSGFTRQSSAVVPSYSTQTGPVAQSTPSSDAQKMETSEGAKAK